jgi:hypothetical protein
MGLAALRREADWADWSDAGDHAPDWSDAAVRRAPAAAFLVRVRRLPRVRPVRVGRFPAGRECTAAVPSLTGPSAPVLRVPLARFPLRRAPLGCVPAARAPCGSLACVVHPGACKRSHCEGSLRRLARRTGWTSTATSPHAKARECEGAQSERLQWEHGAKRRKNRTRTALPTGLPLSSPPVSPLS